MEYATGPPSQWFVTLKDGSVIELWADSYCEQQDQYLFESMVDASHDEQRRVRVMAAGQPRGKRVLILVAQIPAAVVLSVVGGPVEIDPEAG